MARRESGVEKAIREFETSVRGITKGSGIYVVVRSAKKDKINKCIIAWVSIIDTVAKKRETYKTRRYSIDVLKLKRRKGK